MKYQEAAFNYYGSGDESQTLKDSFVPANKGLARNLGILQRNWETQERTAGAGWKLAEDLSPTIKKFAQHRAEKITKRKIAEGREWWYQNGYPEKLKEEHKSGVAELMKGSIESLNLAIDYEDQGGDVFTGERFRKLDDIQQYGAVEGWAIDQANAYNPDSIPEIANALDPVERNAALTAYRMNFWEAMGDINHGIIDQHVDPAIKQAEKSAYSSWYTRRNAEVKADRIEKATKKLVADFKGKDPHKALLFFSEYTEKIYGSKRAGRAAGVKIMNDLARNGQLTPNQINAVRKGKFLANDGSIQTFGDYYGSELDGVINSFHEWQKDERVRSDEKKSLEFKTDEDSSIAKFSPGPNGQPAELELTVANIDAEIQRLGLDHHGFKSTKLQNMRATITKSKIELTNAKNRADIMIRKNIFTEDALKTFPQEIQLDAKYQKAAKAQTNKPAHHTDIFKDNGVIDKLVKKRGSTGIFAKDDSSVVEVTREMKQRYKDLSRDYARTWQEGDPDPYARAWAEVKGWWDQVYGEPGSKNVSAGGFNTALLYNTDGSTNIAESSNDLINKLNQAKIAHNQYGFEGLSMKPNESTGPDSTIYLHRSQVEAASKDIGGDKWKEDKRIRWLADLNGVSYMTALNLQRKALGMEGLDGSPAIDASKKINSTKQTELNKAQNSSQFSRAWSTYYTDTGGSFIEEIVPEGLGKDVLKYSKDFDADPAEFAAGIEMSLLLEGDDVFKDNPDLDPELSAAYWKAVYKYSGGSNLNALNNLKIF